MHATVDAVMTDNVVTVTRETPFIEIVRILHNHRISGLPVLDDEGRVVGVVSEADLLRKEEHMPEHYADDYHPPLRSRLRHHLDNEGNTKTKAAGTVAGALMTAPAITIRADASVVKAARLMDRHGVKRLPVVDDDGRPLGIISRSDVLRVFGRLDAEIEHEIRDAVIARTLRVDPTSVGVSVTEGIVTLEGDVEQRTHSIIAERLARGVDGVVDVVNRLTWHYDDILAQRQVSGP